MILGHSEKVGRCRISYDEEGLLREERESPFFVSYAGDRGYQTQGLHQTQGTASNPGTASLGYS